MITFVEVDGLVILVEEDGVGILAGNPPCFFGILSLGVSCSLAWVVTGLEFGSWLLMIGCCLEFEILVFAIGVVGMGTAVNVVVVVVPAVATVGIAVVAAGSSGISDTD